MTHEGIGGTVVGEIELRVFSATGVDEGDELAYIVARAEDVGGVVVPASDRVGSFGEETIGKP